MASQGFPIDIDNLHKLYRRGISIQTLNSDRIILVFRTIQNILHTNLSDAIKMSLKGYFSPFQIIIKVSDSHILKQNKYALNNLLCDKDFNKFLP